MEQKLAQLQAKIEANPSLVEKLFALETAAEVQSLLKEQGLDFTEEQIELLKKLIVKELEKSVGGSDELSDEELEEVAGGFAITMGVLTAAGAVAGAIFSGGKFTHEVTRGRW